MRLRKKVIVGKLKEYLADHEEDIAIGINDFGYLREVFLFFIGRKAFYVKESKDET